MSLRLAVEQTAPVRGDLDENAARIRRRVGEAAGVDLVLFPELCLTGYALGHRTAEVARRVGPAGTGASALGAERSVTEPERPRAAVETLDLGLPPGGPAAVVGLVEQGEDELVHNTAVVFRGDELLARHRKIYLPTYGMFEEGRHFARGRQPPATFPLPGGWTVGILVCEDLWHPALSYLLALQGADLILVMAAAVGRGRPGSDGDAAAGAPGGGSDPERSGNPEGGEPGGEGAAPPLFASMERWELLARTVAVHNGVYVALCNRVGVEDGFTFAGGSMVVDPSGAVAARAPQGREARLEATLEKEEIRRARHPFSHLRDEDPAFVRDALDRILREREG